MMAMKVGLFVVAEVAEVVFTLVGVVESMKGVAVLVINVAEVVELLAGLMVASVLSLVLCSGLR